MSAERKRDNRAEISLRSLSPKPQRPDPGVSARDKKILDALLAGGKPHEVAEKFGLTAERIYQIRGTPSAVAYMGGTSIVKRSIIYGMSLELLYERIRWCLANNSILGIDDLIKVIKAVEPKQEHDPSAYEWLHAEAERIAEEMNLSPEGKAKVLQLVRESVA